MPPKLQCLSTGKKSIILPIVYMFFIFVLSSIPAQEGKLAGDSFTRRVIQNLLHIPLFGLLAFLWMRAFNKNNLLVKKALIYSLIITVLYAAFDELHQYFVPGRYATLGDFLFNTVGCAGGIFVYTLKWHL